MKFAFKLSATVFLIITVANSALAAGSLFLQDPNTGCTAVINGRAAGAGGTTLTIRDAQGHLIDYQRRANAGEVERQPMNRNGFQVHVQFVNDEDVYFAAWAGGGFDGFPQDYVTVRRHGDTYSAQIERAFFRGTKVFCSGMIRVK